MSKPAVLILNGPNLNLLGEREPETYGTATLADIEAECLAFGESRGLVVACVQSNHEGVLIDQIQQARGLYHGIIINPGGLTHSSVSLRDALVAFGNPVVEVHLSNIHAREEFRHHSFVSPVASGVICGFGAYGYKMALSAMADTLIA